MPQNQNYLKSIKFTTSDGQVHGPFGKIFQLARFGPKGPASLSSYICSRIQYLCIYAPPLTQAMNGNVYTDYYLKAITSQPGEDPACEESVTLSTPWSEYSGTYHKIDQVNGRLGIYVACSTALHVLYTIDPFVA